MSQPILSVIIPSKHAQDKIIRTYESLKPFLGREIELIIQDHKGESLCGFMEGYEGILILNGGDRGTAHAANIALKHACGDYLLFWGAGEICLKMDFARALIELRQQRPQILFNGIRITGTGRSYKPQPQNVENTMSCLTPGAMISREFFNKACGELDERYAIANDYAMFVQLLKCRPEYSVTEHVIVDYDANGISSQERYLEGVIECELIRMREYKKNNLIAAMDLGLACGEYVRQRSRVV